MTTLNARFHYEHGMAFSLFALLNFFALLSACLDLKCGKIIKKKGRMLYYTFIVETSLKIVFNLETRSAVVYYSCKDIYDILIWLVHSGKL